MLSIRNRLLIWVLATFLTATLLVSLVGFYVSQHELEEVFDAELAQSARMISHFTVDQIDYNDHTIKESPGDGEQGHKYEKHVSFQIWKDGELMLKSESAPVVPMSGETGFTDTLVDDKDWRVFALHPANTPYRIYTAGDGKARDDLAENIVQGVGLVVVWALPILAILVFLSVRRGLTPLNNLSRQVKHLDVNELTLLDDQHAPQELKPLVTALNDMLNRLRQTREMERRFIADASHELRTPLSGIKLHAQLARIAADSGERDRELQFIDQAVDRSSRLIEQMLTLARLEPGEQKESMEPIQLMDLIGEIISQLSTLINAQSCQIEIQSDEDAAGLLVRSNRLLLHTLLRNLMDNAIRYGGKEGELEIQLSPGERWTVVRLLDRGPGIPEEHLQQVTERFYRLAGQEIDGCGLGLSIATEAAANIGAELEISNRTDGAGLQVELRLPLS